MMAETIILTVGNRTDATKTATELSAEWAPRGYDPTPALDLQRCLEGLGKEYAKSKNLQGDNSE
jgi:hypothetical protein